MVTNIWDTEPYPHPPFYDTVFILDTIPVNYFGETMNKVILFLIALALLGLTDCTAFQEKIAPSTDAAPTPTPKPGAVLVEKNQWRGGVIGAISGAVAGTTVKEISARGTREAAQSNKPVEYVTMDGHTVYKAYPLDYDERAKCHRVQEKIWEDGRLIKDQIEEVCEADMTENK